MSMERPHVADYGSCECKPGEGDGGGSETVPDRQNEERVIAVLATLARKGFVTEFKSRWVGAIGHN
jgi:hypothetical protein